MRYSIVNVLIERLVEDDAVVAGGEDHAPRTALRGKLRRADAHLRLGAALRVSLGLHDGRVVSDGGGEELAHDGLVLGATLDLHLLLLDLDQALDDEVLEQRGVAGGVARDLRQLLGALPLQVLEQLVARLHLLHPRSAHRIRARPTQKKIRTYFR